VNLNDLRAEADAEHPPVTIGLSDGTDATLTSLLRLPQTVRDTVMAKLADLDSQDAGTEDQANRQAHIAADVLRLVADKGEQLLAELDGDVVLTLKVLGKWRGTE
jgi:hypothetical protein